MSTLILEIHSPDGDVIETVMIEGDNPTRAFSYLEENETPFPVTLSRKSSRGQEVLGGIQRDLSGVWHILEMD